MGFFVVGSRTSRFGGSIFLPVTDIHAGAGKTVDGSKDSEGRTVTKTVLGKPWTVTKTTAVWATKRGRLQR